MLDTMTLVGSALVLVGMPLVDSEDPDMSLAVAVVDKVDMHLSDQAASQTLVVAAVEEGGVERALVVDGYSPPCRTLPLHHLNRLVDWVVCIPIHHPCRMLHRRKQTIEVTFPSKKGVSAVVYT